MGGFAVPARFSRFLMSIGSEFAYGFGCDLKKVVWHRIAAMIARLLPPWARNMKRAWGAPWARNHSRHNLI